MLNRLLWPVARPLARLALRWRLYHYVPPLRRVRVVSRRIRRYEAGRYKALLVRARGIERMWLRRFLPVPMLKERHIRNCRLVTDRYKLLEHVPKGGVCGEIGIARGDYSARILEITEPRVLHLIDNNSDVIEQVGARFASEVKAGKVALHLGDSSQVVAGLKDVRFDWVYIDGDHSYWGVRRDLAAVRPKMKAGGWIVLNDYTYMSPLALVKYGVIGAVNEFCMEYDYEMIYMALNEYGYNDVALRPLGSGGVSQRAAG